MKEILEPYGIILAAMAFAAAAMCLWWFLADRLKESTLARLEDCGRLVLPTFWPCGIGAILIWTVPALAREFGWCCPGDIQAITFVGWVLFAGSMGFFAVMATLYLIRPNFMKR